MFAALAPRQAPPTNAARPREAMALERPDTPGYREQTDNYQDDADHGLQKGRHE